MGREPDERVLANHGTGLFGCGVVLADMDTVGTHLGGQVGAVVEDEGHPEVGADPLEQACPGHDPGIGQLLVAQLHDVDAPLDAAPDEPLEVGPVRGAEIEPAGSEPPALRPTGRAAHPGGEALARASAFACRRLNWRTFCIASGESMSRHRAERAGLTVGTGDGLPARRPNAELLLPSSATKTLAFWSPKPGRERRLARSCLAVGCRGPDGGRIPAVGRGDHRADLLDPPGHGPREPMERWPGREHLGQLVGWRGRDRSRIELPSEPIPEVARRAERTLEGDLLIEDHPDEQG